MKSLYDVVLWLQASSANELAMKTICLRRPWTPQAEARIVQLDEESRLPPDAQADDHKYFLEAPVAREVLDVLLNRPIQPSTDDACNLLIHYAENDAYPDWVHK